MPKTKLANEEMQKLAYNVAEELHWYARASEGIFDAVFERRTRPIIGRLGLDYEIYRKILSEGSLSVVAIRDRIVRDITQGQSEVYELALLEGKVK